MIITTTNRLRVLALLVPFAASLACGGQGSPTAPGASAPSTPSAAPTSSTSTGATIVGTVAGGSSASRAGWHALGTPGVIVTVVGTNVTAVVNTAGSFTLNNVPPIEVALNFSGPGINASVQIGAIANNDQVQVAVTVNGTSATLDTLTSTAPATSTVTMKGVVSSVAGTCPSLSFSIGSTAVQTNGSTTFSSKGCGEITSGDTAGVAGTRGSDGVVTATVVDARPAVTPTPAPTPSPTPTPTPSPTATVTGKGTIDGLIGTCPTLAMSLAGTYVRTDASTNFTGKGCGDLKVGDSIGYAGNRLADTTILATVLASTGTTAPVTVTGALGTFNGTCPNLSMLVGGSSGSYVRTGASTTFTGKSCGDLKSGDVLSIVASNTGDNLGLLASSVAVTGTAPVPPPVAVTFSGAVSGLGGTCPALEMKVGGTYVVANSATTFSGKSCSAFTVGDTVAVAGTHPADSGTVTASTLTVTASAPPTTTTK